MGRVRQKPEGPVSLDRAHPLARKLVCAIPFLEGRGRPREHMTGKFLNLTSNGAWGVGRYGREANFYGFNQYWSMPAPASMQIQAPLTVMAVVNESGYIGDNRTPFGVVANDSYGSPFNSWAIWQNNGSAGNIGLGFNTGFFAQTNTAIPTGQWVVVLCTLTASASEVFFNGVSQATGSGSGSIQYDATATLTMGSWPGSAVGIRVSLGLCWSRLLTKKEICSLANDPFQMFRPRKRAAIAYAPAAAASQGNFFAFLGA